MVQNYWPEMVSSSGESHGLNADRVKESPAARRPDWLGRGVQAHVLLTDAALVGFAGPESGYGDLLQFLKGTVAATERFELKKTKIRLMPTLDCCYIIESHLKVAISQKRRKTLVNGQILFNYNLWISVVMFRSTIRKKYWLLNRFKCDPFFKKMTI